MRQQRIDKAVESLACRPVAEAYPDRVVKETAAVAIRKNTIFDAADNVRLFKNDGYTVDKLMKDVRYRVQNALQNAGLQDAAYAKELVRGLPAN